MYTFRFLLFSLIPCVIPFDGGLFAQTPACTTPARAFVSLHDLKRMNLCQLEELYRNGRVTEVPCGFMKGTPLFSPGTRKTERRARLMEPIWQGKTFDGGALVLNRFCGKDTCPGKVCHGPSWFDGRPSVVLDFNDSCLMFRGLRDEIREIAPGLYLGMSYERQCPCPPSLWIFFVLEACPQGDCVGYPLHPCEMPAGK